MAIFTLVSLVFITFLSPILGYKVITGPPTIPPAASIQTAEQIATGNPNQCPSGTKFFPQPIDHDTFNGNWNDNNSIFHMQYSINDTYYKPGGPILFYQGVEGPITCTEYTNLLTWAAELNALLVSNEHRYFGLSVPHGLNYSESSTWNASFLKPLTIANALRDSISLLAWIKGTVHPAAKNAQVIVVSGSYGGTLASILRTHYPQDIYAAIAASPATKGLVSDPKDPMIYAWGDWSNMVYNDYSVEASAIIRTGMNQLRDRLASGEFASLQSDLSLCTPVNSTIQTNDLLLSIMSAYVLNAQLNLAIFNYPLLQTINATLNATDPFSAIGAAVRISNIQQGKKCLRWNPISTGLGPFNYIRCTQLPYPDAQTRASTIWGQIDYDAAANSTHYQDPWCQSAFGIDSIAGGAALQRDLKVDDASLASTKRLLVVEGLVDPTTALGSGWWLPGSDRNSSRVMWVGQAAHGEVVYPAAVTDSTAITDARLYILNTMKGWLGLNT